jgi:hypothetical protein
MRASQMVFELQSQIKEQICGILINRYKELHDGLLPNWEEEDIVLTENEINNKEVFYLNVITFNTYDNFKELERVPIKRYFVTLDGNLFFEDENENQHEWTEVFIYDLAKILDKLKIIW